MYIVETDDLLSIFNVQFILADLRYFPHVEVKASTFVKKFRCVLTPLGKDTLIFIEWSFLQDYPLLIYLNLLYYKLLLPDERHEFAVVP